MSMDKDGFIDPSDEPAPVLTPAEIAAIKKEAKDKILAERKSAAKVKLLAEETQRLRVQEGMVTGLGHLDEIVNITIDLPTFAPSININMQPYWHGRTYAVPRHVAETLNSQMFTCWKHQNEVDGKSLGQFYAIRRATTMDKVDKGFVPDPYRPGKVAPATVARV